MKIISVLKVAKMLENHVKNVIFLVKQITENVIVDVIPAYEACTFQEN